MKLILGSSSPFRKKLLERFNIDFLCDSPAIDESRLEGEAPEQLVRRLSIKKAQAVAANHTDALVIGSDQIAVFQDQILGKPHSHDRAVEMLTSFSGQTVRFETGLCLLNTENQSHQYECITTRVHFRDLNTNTIENYLALDKPYQCAGSFQAEGLGIVLFDQLESEDPSALIGLPLIALNNMLLREGFDVLQVAMQSND